MCMLGKWLLSHFGSYLLIHSSRGHKDDFAALTAANISLAGKISLAKYGGPFRGVKVLNAEAHGMVGVVMFSDPGDDGPQEAKGQAAYPSKILLHSWSIPRTYVSLTACRWPSTSAFLRSPRIRCVHQPVPR